MARRRTEYFECEQFVYRGDADVYVCPAGKTLTTTRHTRQRWRNASVQGQHFRLRPMPGAVLSKDASPQSGSERPNGPGRWHARSRVLLHSSGVRRDRRRIEMLFAHSEAHSQARAPPFARTRPEPDEFMLPATAQNLRKLARLLTEPPLAARDRLAQGHAPRHRRKREATKAVRPILLNRRGLPRRGLQRAHRPAAHGELLHVVSSIDSVGGIDSVPQALPFLAKACGFNVERLTDWGRQHWRLPASAPKVERLVACAYEVSSPRYNPCRFGAPSALARRIARARDWPSSASETKAAIDKVRAAAKAAYKRELRAVVAERAGRRSSASSASGVASANGAVCLRATLACLARSSAARLATSSLRRITSALRHLSLAHARRPWQRRVRTFPEAHPAARPQAQGRPGCSAVGQGWT